MNFKVYTLSKINNKYTHWSDGLIMYIEKDGIKLKLDSNEIEQLVKSLPRTLGNSY